MKRALLVLCALTLAGFAAAQSSVERGEPLPRKGVLGAALSATQGQTGLTVGNVTPGFTAEKIGLQSGDIILSLGGQAVTSPAAVAPFIRTLAAGDTLRITISRNGAQRELSGPLVARPMQKPDGFRVHYDQVVSQGKRIRIIATYPEAPGKHPTLFLIGGIGAYSVDGDYATTPYGNVLSPIAKAGYTVIRIDKPGQGDSEGPAYPELGFGVEKDAYIQALRLAKTLPFVDADRIALFGHSMGGSFAPLVANAEPVHAIAVKGTLYKTWFEYILENSRRQALLGGSDPGSVDAYIRQLSRVSHHLFNEGLTPAQIIEQHPDLADMMRGMSPDGRTYSGVGIPFFRELAQTNLAEAWSKVNVDVLSIYAANDFLSGQPDHEAIARAIPNGKGQFLLLEGTDHGFITTTSQADSRAKWGQPGGVFNPNIVDALKTWLDKVLKD